MKKVFLSLSLLLFTLRLQAQVPVMVKEVVPGPRGIDYTFHSWEAASGNKFLITADAFYFYSIDLLGKIGFWRSDGTTKGTYPLVETSYINWLASSIMEAESIPAVLFGDMLYFTWFDAEAGTELWYTDGTPEGTGLYLDVLPGEEGSNPGDFVQLDNKLLFTSVHRDMFDTSRVSSMLWITTGFEEETLPLREFYSEIESLSASGEKVFFYTPESQNSTGLWISNGTAEGTKFFLESTQIIVSAYESTFFIKHDTEVPSIWKTDGTPEGTLRLKKLSTGVGTSYPHNFLRAAGKLYFMAHAEPDSITLHVTDGTPAGTRSISNLYYNFDWSLMEFKNRLFYTQGRDNIIRSTDGNTIVEHAVVDAQDLNLVASTDTVLYFSAFTKNVGTRLWQTNGTQEGTYMVINNDMDSPYKSRPSDGFVFKGEIYFLADDGAHGKELWKLTTPESILEGLVYYDHNRNGSFDSGEPGMRNQKIRIEDGVELYTNNAGKFSLEADPGTYTVTAVPADNWQLSSKPESYTIILPGNKKAYFGLVLQEESQALKVQLNSAAPSRCSFEVLYWLDYTNHSSLGADAKIKLHFDARTTLLQSVPAPNSNQEGVLSWHISHDYPGQQKVIKLLMQMPDFNAMGDTIRFYSEASITGTDIIARDTLEQIITCSYDPNDKQVNPAGIEEEHYTLKNSWLDYTIRFQNTGTDTAFTVVLKDTLDRNLDLKTFEIQSSSHNMQTLRKDRALVFQFHDILLPDSNRNESESHGFVRYHIMAKETIAENTVVENKAYIFFDYNPAIETNTTYNTLVSTLPQRQVNGLQDILQHLRLYPNPTDGLLQVESPLPFTEVKLYNTLGKLVFYEQFKKQSTHQIIELDQLPAGLYLICLSAGAIEKRQRIIKQ